MTAQVKTEEDAVADTQAAVGANDVWAALRMSSVALLTTYRRNGQSVGTPVGIRLGPKQAYFTTWSTTGKVKRLANNPRVTLAPCTRRGKVIGASIQGVSRRLDAAAAEEVSARLFRKSLWGRLWDQIYKLRGWQPVLYEISPIEEPGDSGAGIAST